MDLDVWSTFHMKKKTGNSPEILRVVFDGVETV